MPTVRPARRARHRPLTASAGLRGNARYYNVAADCATKVERARSTQEVLQKALEDADVGEGIQLRTLTKKLDTLVREADEAEASIPNYCRLVSHIYKPKDSWSQWAYDVARKRLPRWAGGKRRKFFGNSTKEVCGEKKCTAQFPFTDQMMEEALVKQLNQVPTTNRLAVEYGAPTTKNMPESRGNMCQVLQHLSSKSDAASLSAHLENVLGAERDCPVIAAECQNINLEKLIYDNVLDLGGMANVYEEAGGVIDTSTPEIAFRTMQATVNEKRVRPTPLQIEFCKKLTEYIEAQNLLREYGLYDMAIFDGDNPVSFEELVDEFTAVVGFPPDAPHADGFHLALRYAITSLYLARQMVGRLKILQTGAFSWESDADTFQREVNDYLSDLFPGYSEKNTTGSCADPTKRSVSTETKTPSVYQQMFSRFVTPRTMCRLPQGPFGILQNWSTGTGKTCALLAAGREFRRRTGWRVIWLADIVNKNAYKKDLWCLGAGVTFPESHVFTTGQFIKIFTGSSATGVQRLRAGGRNDDDLLARTLILYDEAHKGFENAELFLGNPLFKKKIPFNTLLKEQLRNSYHNSGPENCCRIILATATPGDPCEPMRVAKLLNMLYSKNVVPEEKQAFATAYLTEPNRIEGIQRFRETTKGAISYLFFMGNRFFAKVEEEHVKIFIDDPKYRVNQNYCLSQVPPGEAVEVVRALEAGKKRSKDEYAVGGFVVMDKEYQKQHKPKSKAPRSVKKTRLVNKPVPVEKIPSQPKEKKEKKQSPRKPVKQPKVKVVQIEDEEEEEEDNANAPAKEQKEKEKETPIVVITTPPPSEKQEEEIDAPTIAPKKKKTIRVVDYELPPRVTTRYTYNRDDTSKAATCLRRSSTVPRKASTGANFSEAERRAFAKQLQTDNSQSFVAAKILENIIKLDGESMRNEGKLYKHIIYSELGDRGWGEFMFNVLVEAGATGICYRSELERGVYDKAGITFETKEIRESNEPPLIKGTAIVLRKMTATSHGECNKNKTLNPSSPAAINKALFERVNARPDNVYGEQVRFIILDRLKESVDIFDPGYMHVVEPPLNDSDRLQLVGRVRRYCGQTGLPRGDGTFRPVKVFFYEPIFKYVIQESKTLQFIDIPSVFSHLYFSEEKSVPLKKPVASKTKTKAKEKEKDGNNRDEEQEEEEIVFFDAKESPYSMFEVWKESQNALTIPEFIAKYARKEDVECDEAFYERVTELLRMSAFDRDLLVAYNGCIPQQRSMNLLQPVVPGTQLPPVLQLHETCQ